MSHANARLTPAGRLLQVERIEMSTASLRGCPVPVPVTPDG